MEYDQGYDHALGAFPVPTLGETLEPYIAAPKGPIVKLSISLPQGLLEPIRAVARESGTSVSAVIAAALRRTVGEIDQALLDAALEADADQNVEWAVAAAPMDAALLADLEW